MCKRSVLNTYDLNNASAMSSVWPTDCKMCTTDDGDDGGFRESAGWDDTNFGNDESIDTADLLEAPRKVEKISVTYSKASKQV